MNENQEPKQEQQQQAVPSEDEKKRTEEAERFERLFAMHGNDIVRVYRHTGLL